jgi:hypothetical protein
VTGRARVQGDLRCWNSKAANVVRDARDVRCLR